MANTHSPVPRLSLPVRQSARLRIVNLVVSQPNDSTLQASAPTQEKNRDAPTTLRKDAPLLKVVNQNRTGGIGASVDRVIAMTSGGAFIGGLTGQIMGAVIGAVFGAVFGLLVKPDSDKWIQSK